MDTPRGNTEGHATAAQGRRARWPRPGLPESAYVLGVTAVAAWGFATESTAGILLAVLLALPMGAPALIGYYLVYGLLAQVPGANPDIHSGSIRCSPGGACHEASVGDPAAWFTHSMDAVGVLALSAAAVLNVVVLRGILARRRDRRQRLASPSQ